MALTPDPLVERYRGVVGTVLDSLPAGGTAEETWARVTEAFRSVEIPAVEAPIGLDGYDLGLATGLVACAELGRRALPPVYGASAFVVDALAESGDPQGIGPGIVSGQTQVVVAGLDRLPAGAGASTTLSQAYAGAILGGSAAVDAAAQGHRVFVVARADQSFALVALRPGQGEPSRTPLRDLAVLSFDGVVVDERQIVADVSDAAVGKARIRHAAYLVGLAEGAFDLAAARASSRVQFGQRLIEFQALRFGLAELSVELSGAALALRHAASLADAGADVRLEAAQLAASSAELAVRATSFAVQLHGAFGLTEEAAVSAFYRRVQTEAARCGRPTDLWREAGRHRLARRQARAPGRSPGPLAPAT